MHNKERSTTDVVGGIDKNKQNSSKTNKGKQTSSTSDIYKIVCMIMVCNYHPVIVFCFFKHNCKDMVTEVFNNAIL
ncbi:ATP-dependent RNA helicase mtr4 [Coemansia sp. RSA 2702]|nr:ATP-dependent RNA helicase mtr4 [Coemansia sp. RSA 2702]